MKILPLTANDLSIAAAARREAREKYREALRSGNLGAAVKAREADILAEVTLDRIRMLIEGAA